MNDIVTYSKENLGEVRVKGDFENPLFCLVDICKILGLTNSSAVKKALNSEFGDDLSLTYPIIDSLGREQKAIFITEMQLYFLLMRSDKENAKSFRLWLNNEVLPSIRKTGSYNTQKLDYKESLNKLIELAKSNIELLEKNEKLETITHEQKYRLNVYSDSFAARRDTKKLRTHFNNLVRKLANQRGSGYSEAFNFVYSEFSKLHCFYDTDINIDFVCKNLDYLNECIEIALYEINKNTFLSI